MPPSLPCMVTGTFSFSILSIYSYSSPSQNIIVDLLRLHTHTESPKSLRMMAAVLIMAGMLSVVAGSKSGLGFDASEPVSVGNFKDLSAAGFNYTILRGYRCKSGGESAHAV